MFTCSISAWGEGGASASLGAMEEGPGIQAEESLSISMLIGGSPLTGATRDEARVKGVERALSCHMTHTPMASLFLRAAVSPFSLQEAPGHCDQDLSPSPHQDRCPPSH